jgi:CheY-like chemotaxis protein
MPVTDGYMLMKQIRKSVKFGNIPALALTAYARTEDRMRAVRAGFDLHVVKPVHPGELITMVSKLAGRIMLNAA